MTTRRLPHLVYLPLARVWICRRPDGHSAAGRTPEDAFTKAAHRAFIEPVVEVEDEGPRWQFSWLPYRAYGRWFWLWHRVHHLRVRAA